MTARNESSKELLINILNTHCVLVDGWQQHSSAYRLNYLIELMSDIADKHPYIAAELREKLNYLKGM